MELTKIIGIAIACENASERMGGEAIIPLKLFREYRKAGATCYLFTHERVADELKSSLTEDEIRFVYFVPDSALQRCIFKIGLLLPERIRESLVGVAIQLLTQGKQKELIRNKVAQGLVNVIHVPTPISPRAPSRLSELGAPVYFGPLNGNINYPKNIGQRESFLVQKSIESTRVMSNLVHHIYPGKKNAHGFFICNERTKTAVPTFGRDIRLYDTFDNGIDVEHWSEALTQEPKQENHFIYVGRLVYWKGVDLLIRAVAHANCDLTLTIVGDGPARIEFEKLAVHLGVKNRIEFVGYKNHHEILAYYRQACSLVLPSLREAGGTVIIEAMASELAVIATNWGGIPDYVTKETGILVEPSSTEEFVEGLANAMIRLKDDPSLAREMGLAARQHAISNFSWDKKAQDFLNIFAQNIS